MEEQAVAFITKKVIEALEKQNTVQPSFMLPIAVSGRHVHLTKQDVETLFGKGYELTQKKELMGGQFAANEQVTIVGTKLRAIENVRVLGPVRKDSQIEISKTDAFKLGIGVPIRESGNIKDSAAIAVVGPKGVVYLKEGCIIAKRHIHMSLEDATKAEVKDGDVVSVKVDNIRGTTFNHVQIRIDQSFTLEMHIDADEANAADIATGGSGFLIKA